MGVVLLGALSAWHVQSACAGTLIQTTAYDYEPATGFLSRQAVEPNTGDLCLVTVIGYDQYGNKNTSTARNCNGSTGQFPGSGSINTEVATPGGGNLSLITSRNSVNATTYNSDGTVTLTTTTAATLSNGTVTTTSLSESEVKTFEARFGAATSLTGPNQLTTSWKYDDLGRKVWEQRPDLNGTTWSYQYCSPFNGSNVACATVPALTSSGAATTITPAYVVTATPVAGVSVGTLGAANGPISKTYYDTLNRVIRQEVQCWDGAAAQLCYQDTRYNALGQVDSRSRPYFAGGTAYWTQYSYDPLGRVILQTEPDGSKTTTVYNGLSTSIINDLGQTTTQTRDVTGVLAQVTDANAKNLTFATTYDASNRSVQTTTDSAGNVTTVTADVRGRKVQMQTPDMGTWTYAYNVAGELIKQTDAKGQITTITYDVLGRQLQKTEPSLTTNWSYDKYADGSACNKGVGKLCEVGTTQNYKRKLGYDSVGRPSTTTTTVGATVYTSTTSYNSDGRVNTITYPKNYTGTAVVLQNVYGPLGDLKQVVDANAPSSVYWKATTLDAIGHITNQLYGNTVSTTSTYDPQTGRLMQTVAGASNAVQNLAYTYDTLGNLKTRVDAATGVSASYTYDVLNRLKTETRQGGGLTSAQTITWAYNDIGNLTSRSDVGSYAYNPSGASSVRPHAVTGVTGTVNAQGNPAYSYDTNGNLTSETVGGATIRTIGWNSFNKVDNITQTAAGVTNRVEYIYDSDLDRVQETTYKNSVKQRTTTYLNPGSGAGLFYEEETGVVGGVTGTKRKFYINASTGTVAVLTLTNDTTWSTQYWHKDQLGSTAVITDAAGAVIERLAYEPFGKRRNADGTTDPNGTLTAANTRRGYTGHEMIDEIGLVNMNGRIFDPAIGRFLSADPNVPNPQSMQSYARYTYVENNPFAGTDPSGYFDSCYGSVCFTYDFYANNSGGGINVGIGGNNGGLPSLPSTPSPSLTLPVTTAVYLNSSSSYTQYGGYNSYSNQALSQSLATFWPDADAQLNATSWSPWDRYERVSRLLRNSGVSSTRPSDVSFDLVGYLTETYRSFADNFVRDNQASSAGSDPYLRWLARLVTGTYQPPNADSINGKLASATTDVTYIAGLILTGRTPGGVGPVAGGGAKLENLTAQEITRIQNAANRTGTSISVVGSRANGTSRALSDWDYVLPEATSKRTIHSLSSSLPEGPRGLGEVRNQDFFRATVDQSKPYITFTPQ